MAIRAASSNGSMMPSAHILDQCKASYGQDHFEQQIISHTSERRHENCSFTSSSHHGNKGENNGITLFLLSMAWQMALLNKEVLDTVLKFARRMIISNYRTVWRSSCWGASCASLRPYSIALVDTLDECKTEPGVVSVFTNQSDECVRYAYL